MESTTGVTTGLSSGGHWRVGADNMTLWPDADSRAADVRVDSPAVYHRTLTSAQVAQHYRVGYQQASENGHFLNTSGVAQVWFTDGIGGDLRCRIEVEDSGAQRFFAGDWDGDGIDDVGYRVSNVFHLINRRAGREIVFGYGRPGDEPYIGDWDGDGRDSIALRRGNHVYASDDFRGGIAPTEFAFGRVGDAVFIGDWTGEGVDGMMLGRGETYYVADRLRSGEADRSFRFPTPNPAAGGGAGGTLGRRRVRIAGAVSEAVTGARVASNP